MVGIWAICSCQCHNPGLNMMHCMPCCSGVCPVCNAHIKGDIEAHLKDRHPDYKEITSANQADVKGKWYFVYQGFDVLENNIDAALAFGLHKEDLDVSTEEEAIKVATEKWSAITKKSLYEGWDKKTYPNSPRVVYEISLS